MVDVQLVGQSGEGRRPPRLPWWGFALAGGAILTVLAVGGVRGCPRSATVGEEPVPPPEEAPIDSPMATNLPAASAFAHMTLPTPRTNLLDAPIAVVIQPTASGKPESGLFGSVRTANFGRLVLPSFHEGIDIAPVGRDRHGQPLDNVTAVAEGRVGYINLHEGNSNYGEYVIVLHTDPVGEVYTLYAHLAAIAPGLAIGQAVTAGTVLGRMGRTPHSIIPLERAHTHFEVGVIANDRFPQWMEAHRTRNAHGRFNGWNLLGLDPLDVLKSQRQAGADFSILAYLASVPVAFELVVPASRLPDFFRRHPVLWEGGAFSGPAMVVACSEGGVPLHGRPATPEEAARAPGKKTAVLAANASVLGRNGRRIVIGSGATWRLGEAGQRWADILLY